MASLLYCLADKLVTELCSPVFQDVGKSWGFGTKNEFEKLEKTLSAIKAVLLDTEEKQRTNRQVQDWLMKIKLVFYDVEDLLLAFSTKALKRQVMTKNKGAKEVRIFFSSSNQVKYRLKMGGELKLIREQLDAIASDHYRFNLTEWQEDMHFKRINIREDTHSFVPLEKVIGRDKDRRDVTELLLKSNSKNNVSVISIVGIGGMGKTTLAKSIYSSEEVKSSFELMIWVCVSDVFDLKLICHKIIESATEQKCESLQMNVVKEKLKRVIDGKKYLLVLDDLWNEYPTEWMKLDELLTGGAEGSKILITARAELVARVAESIATHSLEELSPEESWALFKQVAFKQGVEPESLIIVGIGKKVVKICAGVPLTIKTIGSMLGLKDREIDWLDFEKNDLPLITQDGEGRIIPILKLSYDYLSAPLKRCFAYFAIFPKDWKITKKSLIRMWMAHGLVQLDGTRRSLEDIGEKHIIDLLDRSLLEVYDKNNDSDLRCFKMHDLVHDLAKSVGGNEYCKLNQDVNCIDETTRHVWVSQHMSTNLLHAKKLRTLVVRDSCDVLNGHTVNEILSMFKQMRVLDWRRLNITGVPRFFNGLRHLNYLDLSYGTFDLLPESICTLYNLQTLLLEWCKNLKELPTRTRNLVSLRHLEISGCGKLNHMPRGMEELTCLQTLTDFVMGPEDKDCGKLGELESLVNLKGELRLRNLRGSKVVKSKRGQSCSPNPLAQLKFVLRLELTWSCEDQFKEADTSLSLFESLKPHPNLEKLEIYGYGFSSFPSWMDRVHIGVSLLNIVYICLNSCDGWQHLPPFGLLPSLERLNLWRMGSLEYIYEEEESASCSTPKTPDQLFPSLKMLVLHDMPKLTRLVRRPTATPHVINGYFPVLEKLVILDCPLFVADGSDDNDGKQFQSLTNLREVKISFSHMEALPARLQCLPHLQTFELSSCDKIVTLPEWMGNLASLQEIRLVYCKSLASIPDCMPRLTSLQRLRVEGCRELFRRCEKETGVDWHKISHIPNVLLKEW